MFSFRPFKPPNFAGAVALYVHANIFTLIHSSKKRKAFKRLVNRAARATVTGHRHNYRLVEVAPRLHHRKGRARSPRLSVVGGMPERLKFVVMCSDEHNVVKAVKLLQTGSRAAARLSPGPGSIAFDGRILSWNLSASGIRHLDRSMGRLAVPFLGGSASASCDLLCRDGLW